MYTVALLVIWFGAIIGWIANIWQIAVSINDAITALLVLKIVGIFFAPLGSILGLLGMF